MLPEDAEEVFELLNIGSRIEIVYELISVDTEDDSLTIRIHQDIYGKGIPSEEQIALTLSNHGLNPEAIDALVPKALGELSQPTGLVVRVALPGSKEPQPEET